MAVLKVYAEVGADGGCLLYSFDPPGLLARGATEDEAMAAAPGALAELRQFLAECNQQGWLPGGDLAVEVAERKCRRGVVANGMTSVTFQRDRVPLLREEIPPFLAVLDHQRLKLLELKERIPPQAYGFKSLPRRKTIAEQLTHIAACDRWYLSRIWQGLPRLRRSRDVWDKLSLNRDLVRRKLMSLTDADLSLVVAPQGEVWTCRKLLRRLMYHEKFHLDTILRDLRRFNEQQG